LDSTKSFASGPATLIFTPSSLDAPALRMVTSLCPLIGPYLHIAKRQARRRESHHGSIACQWHDLGAGGCIIRYADGRAGCPIDARSERHLKSATSGRRERVPGTRIAYDGEVRRIGTADTDLGYADRGCAGILTVNVSGELVFPMPRTLRKSKT
jgi:hypothetical protein